MREQNGIAINSPSVLVVSNSNNVLKQDYEYVTYEMAADFGDFNSAKQKPYDLYCFLTKEFNFKNAKSLQRAVTQLSLHPFYSALYSDLVIIGENNIEIYRPQQSYTTGLILNCPFLVRSGLEFNFSSDKYEENQILFSGLNSISSKSLMYHLAEPVFIIKYAESHSAS